MGELSETARQTGLELYEFGPFRLDVQRQLLLRTGTPVPLTPKSFQVLLVLVRRSHEVVTKDDLMKEVWQDTFVDEANVSRQIFMLRKALGESPQDHEYIVTVPGKGYRLAQAPQLVPLEPALQISRPEPNGAVGDHDRLKAKARERKLWLWVVLAAVLLAVLSAAAIYKTAFHASASLTNKDTLVLAEFTNSTGDTVFDDTLREGWRQNFNNRRS